jgi:hypothetical protein
MADCVVMVKDADPLAHSAAKRDRKCLGVDPRADEWTFGGQHREHLPQRFLVDRGRMPDLNALDVLTVGAPNALVNELGDQR